MVKLRRSLFSLAVIALVGIMAGEARSAPISILIEVGNGAEFLVDPFAETQTANKYDAGPAGISAINTFLAANGSQYQFVTLGGSSNHPGDATQGYLTMTGEIHSVGTAGSDPFLEIEQTNTNFTAPNGLTGLLRSSSVGNFTNQPAGAGHNALSEFNPPPGDVEDAAGYPVFSSGTDPNGANGKSSLAVAPVGPLYTLENSITFGLAKPAAGANDIIDGFSVTATVTANVIPEPASIVMFLTGMPLPLVVVGLLRRRRRALAQG